MKLSLKHSSLVMAACASLYALSILIFDIPRIVSLPIGKIDIYYLPHVAMLIGMIIFGIGLYQNQEQIPRLTKSLRWQAIGIVTMVLGVLVYNCFFNGSIWIGGMSSGYWNPWLHFIIILWVVAWLLQFGFAKHENTYTSTALGAIGIIVSLAAALILILMVVSFVRVLMTGYVAGFQTTAWLSWLRPFALIALGGTMLMSERSVIIAKDQTDSEINEVQSYSRANQIIAKVSISAVLCFIIIGIIGGIFNWFSHHNFRGIYTITTFAFVHMLWISSMIAMLLEKVLPRWHRTLNILAPIVINGVLVLLALYAQVELSYNIPNFIEDFLCLCLLVSLIFVIIVWLINTIIVLRTIARTKEKK